MLCNLHLYFFEWVVLYWFVLWWLLSVLSCCALLCWYDILNYLVISPIAFSNFVMWSGLLVNAESWMLGSWWLLGRLLMLLLLCEGADLCWLLGSLFLVYLASVWMSRIGLHQLHIDSLQYHTRCGQLQVWQGPMIFWWLFWLEWWCYFHGLNHGYVNLQWCGVLYPFSMLMWWHFELRWGFYLAHSVVIFGYVNCGWNEYYGPNI